MKSRDFSWLAVASAAAVLLVSPIALHAAEPAPKEGPKEAPKDAPKETPKENADPKMITGWGRWQDPDRDCKYKLETGRLLVWVPGTAHDLSAENNKMNAPMVLQDAKGDFDVTVRVSGTFTPGAANVAGRTPYQGSGLVLAQDNRNYLRLERAVFTNAGGQNYHYVNFEVRLNGQVQRLGEAADHAVPENIPVYLRIERRGAQVRGSVSEDGTNWQNLGIKNFVGTPQLLAGVATVNATNSPMTIQFESLKLTSVGAAKE